ncbi:MAG: DDE-type integrase/transposase/recombinase [Acidobacteriota bacterium]|nr:DDE-type integrase/transposase/recombinase [Acidobacteriota bacterium]
MSTRKKPDPLEVALFRYRVIAPLLNEPLGKVSRKAREQAGLRWEIPGSDRTRVATETVRSWFRLYRRGGLDALRPKERSGRGPRSLDPEVVEALIGLKRELPRLSVRLLIEEARDRHLVPESVPLPHSTVHRMFRGEGLMGRPGGDDGGKGRDRRRFAYELAGEMWQSDVLHGPKVRDGRGRLRKVYLIAFLDDATRVIPYAEFAFSERVTAFLPVFRQAIERRGVPMRLFVDNGPNYRSRALDLACARLGIVLIHARPFDPAGKGKIERWLRTVREQFLSRLAPEDLRSLDALNAKLREWIEGKYHRTPHHGLGGDTPLERWARHGGEVRHVDHGMDLGDLFMVEKRRKVRKDRTVRLDGRVYEAEARLIGERVILRYDPAAPPSRPVQVIHEGQGAGVATLLDLHANARVRRKAPRNALSFRDLDPDRIDADETTGNTDHTEPTGD